MNYILTIFLLVAVKFTFAQTTFPDFLVGTWKMENQETYEHWDKLDANKLKGLAYKVEDGKMVVAEYLDIQKVKKKIVYTATVLDQNGGVGINFTLTQSDSSFVFENPKHDFPKKVIYQRVSDSEIYVQVSDGKQDGFAYTLRKQVDEVAPQDSTNANPNYDATLAAELGSDDYGMKSYFFVILKTGANTTTDKELINASFRGHMENINRLVEAGILIVAGPMDKNESNYRGLFVLNNVATLEEAKEILSSDSAIKNGLLDCEIFTWYGSAALPEYLPFSEKIWKLKP